MDPSELGKAEIKPKRAVTAGEYTTITYTYTTGHPVDDTGFVKVTFRYAGDFGLPQFDNPAAPNYVRISTNGNCRIEARWDVKGHTRPWGGSLYMKIMGGYLNTGDQITVIFGDKSHGSPGWQMQTFCESTFEFKTLVDPIASYQFKELPDPPTLRIKPGKPARALCIAPSRVKAGEKFTYFRKLEDRWGNPVRKPAKIKHKGFKETGFHSITTKDKASGLSAVSNPIEVVAEDPEQFPFWGDIHGQSEETIGTNSIDDYFTFARDYALLDVTAHQGNDFQITDDFWKKINQVTKDFNKPGSFVTFPGYEWSGNTPLGGDRNVWFTTEGGKITRSSNELLPDGKTAFEVSPDAYALFANLKKQKSPKPFVFAHVGGRYADVSIHDEDLELAVEAHSAWGTFEWMIEDALSRGYRVGICANSDGHKGRPGASYAGAGKFGSLGGLTCFLAPKLDRQSILKAITERRFYGTTGNRSLINLELETAEGKKVAMGELIETGDDSAKLKVTVCGTAPIETVQVRNGLKTVKTLYPYGKDDLGKRIKIVWSGAEVRGRARMVTWDGLLHIKGNSVLDATPINFWNANKPLVMERKTRLAWKSVTTGGVSGMILNLKRPHSGELNLETLQRRVSCKIASVGLKPKTWNCGGLAKKIEISRLPDKPESNEFSFTVPLKNLTRGDNPIYIRVAQEDGHFAWTSPVYLVKK